MAKALWAIGRCCQEARRRGVGVASLYKERSPRHREPAAAGVAIHCRERSATGLLCFAHNDDLPYNSRAIYQGRIRKRREGVIANSEGGKQSSSSDRQKTILLFFARNQSVTVAAPRRTLADARGHPRRATLPRIPSRQRAPRGRADGWSVLEPLRGLPAAGTGAGRDQV